MMMNELQHQESQSLQQILGSQMTVDEFFDSHWQKKCVLFQPEKSQDATTNKRKIESTESASISTEDPYSKLMVSGWSVLLNLLQESKRLEHEQQEDYKKEFPSAERTVSLMEPMIFFQDLQALSMDERAEQYRNSPFAAFLDGCSLVQNHADTISAALAELCEDLQLSFPHVYCNTYITPADAQAAPAHADDRDVFVIQVYGQKHWTVYQTVPIPYPYPHEQVGKQPNLPVPYEVLQGPRGMEVVLQPGHVLYMPRGYVHQADCNTLNAPSFHVTIALATHDWTLAGLVTQQTQRILCSQIPYRMALPLARPPPLRRCHGATAVDKEQLQQSLNQAMDLLQQTITVESIQQQLEQKLAIHNERATQQRKVLFMLHQQQQQNEESPRPKQSLLNFKTAVVGPEATTAGSGISLDTLVRVTTDTEKQAVQQATRLAAVGQPQPAVGLLVRQCIANDVAMLLQTVKCHPNQSFSIHELKQQLQDPRFCDLTLICFVHQCVTLGALAIVEAPPMTNP